MSMTPVLKALAADRDRVVFRDRRGEVTAGEALDAVYRFARALAAHGHGPGRSVALLGPVSTWMYLLSQAAELTGGIQAEIPVSLPAEYRAPLLRECDVAVVVADPDAVDASVVREVAGLPGVRLLTLGPCSEGEDLLRDAADRSPEPFASLARDGEPHRIVLTGGTTGRAKPVLRRYRPSHLSGSSWFVRFLGRSEQAARVLKTGRLTGLGRALGSATVVTGGTFVTLPEFDPAEVVSVVTGQGITHAFLSPHELRLLLDDPASEGADLSGLRGITTVTAATAPALLERAVERFGPIVYPGYGQTEAGHIAWLLPEDYASPRPEVLRSCGRPLPGVDVEVRGGGGGVLGPGERGRVWVRTPLRMDEYWKRPDDTARVLRDGWLDTGDVGFLDARGYLTLLGRSGEAVEVAGGAVFASEVDTVLQEHPGVRESATFGVHGDDGTSLHSAVVTAPGAQVGEGDLLEMLGRLLDPGRVPSTVMFVPRIPLTYANELCLDTLRSWHAAPAAAG